MKAELKNITLKMVPEGNDFHFYDTKNQQFIFHKQKGAPYGNIYQSFKGELSYLYFVKYTLNDKLPIILPNNYPKEVLKVGFSSKENRNKRAKKSREFMLPLTETQEIILEKDILSIICMKAGTTQRKGSAWLWCLPSPSSRRCCRDSIFGSEPTTWRWRI